MTVTNGERVRELEVRMEQVEEGVANFRAFQLENRDYMGWSRRKREEDEARDKRRSKIHFALLGALLTLAIGIATALWQMWANGHKIVTIDSPQHSQNLQPQDATIPPVRRGP